MSISEITIANSKDSTIIEQHFLKEEREDEERKGNSKYNNSIDYITKSA